MKTNNEKRFTEVCILDTCLPDYFSGYSFPVLAVPMHNQMTKHEFANELRSEVNSIYDHLETEFTEDDIKMFDQYVDRLLSEEDVVIHEEENEVNSETEMECVYTYLSLCKPVFRYGMYFLNE